ncbi:MAG TPA: hypothetical protein VFC82_01060 [Actinomycetaceae bacterium]|nr:hypothetical protein [Actinomycetaceae bacterium]
MPDRELSTASDIQHEENSRRSTAGGLARRPTDSLARVQGTDEGAGSRAVAAGKREDKQYVDCPFRLDTRQPKTTSARVFG